jgi:dTDP-L-rhamnose 4-epimerase
MKVLVTGGAGFIGSHTTDLLLQKGYQVRVLDSLAAPVHPHGQKPEYLNNEAEFILGDVRDRSILEKALQGVNAVIYLAAHQGYLPDFSTFASVNDFGMALLFEVIVADRLPVAKIVVASSQAVYGEGKYQCSLHGIQYPSPRPLAQLKNAVWDVKCPVCGRAMRNLPTDEVYVNPHGQYAVSKYAQELYGLVLGRKYGIPTVALRYSITQGARQSFHNAYSGILRIFTLRLLNGLPPVIYEDGNQLRDYVYVGDVARANLLALENAAADYEAFNVGGNQILTVTEYAAMLSRIMGIKVSPVIPGEIRYGDVRHIVSDITKICKLGWQPTVSIEQIAREYIDWASKQPEASDHYAEAEKVMKQKQAIMSTGPKL